MTETTYKGLTVWDTDPSGEAGLAINNNFKSLADSIFYGDYITGLLVNSDSSDTAHDVVITNGKCASSDGFALIENTVGDYTISIDSTSDRVDGSTLDANTNYYILVGTESSSFVAGFSKVNSLPSGWTNYKAIDVRETDGSSNLRDMEMTEGEGLRRVNIYNSPTYYDYGTAAVASTPTLYSINVPHVSGIEAMVMGYFASSAIICLNHGTLSNPPTRGGKEHRGNGTDQNRFDEILSVNSSGQIYVNYAGLNGTIGFSAVGYSAWRALS